MNKKTKITILSVIGLIALLCSFDLVFKPTVVNADFLGIGNFAKETYSDAVACFKGECSDDDVISFTKFEGELSPPSTEGYDEGLVRQTDLKAFIKNITNFALGFLGLISVIIVIYGGARYILSAGEPEGAEKGKKAIMYAVIGLLIIMGSYAIVNTVLLAPTGDDIDRQGGSGFGESLTTGSGTIRLSLITARIETIAVNLITAHVFHFEAMNDLNTAIKLVEDVKIHILYCRNKAKNHSCGVGSKETSSQLAKRIINSMTPPIDDAINILNNVKNSIPNVVSLSSLIRASIDEEIDSMKELRNYIKGREGILESSLLSQKDLNEGGWDADDIEPAIEKAFRDFHKDRTSKSYEVKDDILKESVINDRVFQAHKSIKEVIKSNFRVTVNDSIKELKEIHDVVKDISPNAKDKVEYLVSIWELGEKQCKVDIQKGAFMPEAALCELNKIVFESEKTILVPSDNEYIYMEKVYNALQDLYLTVSTLQFVEARLTASIIEGSAPLAVTFSSVGSKDPSGLTIEDSQVEWDLNGDGEYNNQISSNDFTSCEEEESATASCIYNKPGTYRVRLKINSSEKNILSTDSRFTDKNKKYSDVIAPGIATIEIKIHEPKTRINLDISNLTDLTKEDVHANKIRSYDDKGFLEIDRGSVVFPLSKASSDGVNFDASLTTTKDGKKISSEASEGATVYWDFGDGSSDGINKSILSATDGNLKQTHKYEKEGSYNVVVEFTDKNQEKDRKIFTLTISSLAPSISISNRKPKIGEEIKFDASNSISDNGPISYEWKIGSETKKDEVFVYKFDTPNKYEIRLSASDPIVSNMTVSDIVEVKKTPPVAQFSYSFKDENQPGAITLDGSKSFDTEGDEKLKYKWFINDKELDDKLTSESDFSFDLKDSAKPVIKFKNSGEYNIKLIAIDPNGGGSGIEQYSEPLEKEIIIEKTIDVGWGTKDKTSAVLKEQSGGEMGADISLTLVSENAIAYEVDYGDDTIEQGEMNREKTLNHTYKDSGTFAVKVSVFDKDDEENKIQRKVFISSAEKPVSVISVSVNENPVFDLTKPLEINRKDVISFDAGESLNVDGTGRRLTYSWDLGDGTRSTNKTINNTFKELGDYKVTLKVVNENDVTMSSLDTIDIKVKGEPPYLRSLTAIPAGASMTAPVTIRLNAVGAEDSDGKITRYRWWYYDPSSDSDQLGVQITTSPSAEVVIGTRGSEGEEKTYRFGVELTDDENNTVSSQEILSRSLIPEITVINGPNKPPVSSFSVDRTTVFVGEAVNFTSSSVDPDGQIVGYYWDFEGDGFANNTTSLGANVSYIFEDPAPNGVKVRLKVKDNNESEAISDPVIIYVESMAEPPKSAFSYEQQKGTKKVVFKDNSTADELNKLNIVKWNWDFDVNVDSDGDGKKDNDIDSKEQNPSNSYEEYGVYRVKLTVVDNEGGESSVTNFVQVKTPEAQTGGVNIFGINIDNLLMAIVSMLTFAIIITYFTKVINEK